MSQLTFFEAPAAYQQRIQALELLQTEDGVRLLRAGQARQLLEVELTFALAEFLGFDDEPVTALWALLSGMPLREDRLRSLDAPQRRALANVRQLVPYGPRFAWLNALRDYLTLPAMLRSYDFDPTSSAPTIIVNAKRPEPDRLHAELYQQCLTTALLWRQRQKPKTAQADKPYLFTALVPTEEEQPLEATVQVTFSEAALAGVPPLAEPWFDPHPPKEPMRLAWSQLREVAEEIDRREVALQSRYPGYRPQGWASRFANLTLELVQGNELLPTEELCLNQFVHIAGMVASGKSTLATLLAAYFIHCRPTQRLTIVVGDVQSAVGLANQLNTWFREDPETEQPGAVPLLGRSTREAHRRAFAHSDDYRQHLARQQPHWGERWLSPLCPLQACLTDGAVDNQLAGHLLPTGKEPCQTLRAVKPAPAEGPRRVGRRAAPVAPEAGRTRYSCPFLPACPQYQMYRDMPTAAVWITTPGGLTSGSLPPQLENRPLKLGELVYEQSDLVIFDEADTIIKWLDDHYAQELKLTGGRQGLLDTITLPTERHTIGARVMPPGTQRWVGAERAAQQVVSAVLTMLDPGRGPGFLQQWVANHQFTPLTLGYRLARAVAGLEDYDRPEVAEELRQANDELTRAVLAPFEALFDEPDPLRPLRATNPSAATQALWQLVQRINNTDESATDAELRAECSQWLRNFGLSQVPDGAERPVAAVERLAYQLQFVLTVALLDRHSRIVFYEWDQRPAGVQVDAPNYRSRAAMQSLLPLPLTGRQFGTYYARAGSASGSAGHALSLFAYTNVGRHYVLHYHELFADLTGERGPNVLAMSGTSYLPASTTFHVSRPQALLLPPPEATAAIAQSKFAFLPQRDATDKGIRISGGGRQVETPGRITELIKGLVGRDGQGRLAGMLNTLARAEEREPALWADRGRLLLFVNSYEQAHRAAEALRRYWPACRDGIRHLLPRLPATGAPEGGLLRADIEQFAHAHDGCVLVAPLNAVGRGFNILNTRGKAAFGAVYFLTRPYPHPNDAQAVARELNRRTFDWAADENLAAWQTDGLLGKADAARRLSLRYWGRAESRAYYSTLADDPDLGAYPRRDLAATTIGYVIQAVGRLLRGGVPFHAFFVDAAWGPRNADRPDSTARLDSPKTSLLAAMLELLAEYTAEDEDENDDPVGRALYAPLQAALDNIEGFNWEPDAPKKYRKA